MYLLNLFLYSLLYNMYKAIISLAKIINHNFACIYLLVECSPGNEILEVNVGNVESVSTFRPELVSLLRYFPTTRVTQKDEGGAEM